MTLLRFAAFAAPLMLLACDIDVEKSDSDTGATVGDDDDTPTGDDDDDDDDGHATACAGVQSGTYDVDGYPLTGGVEGELLADGTLFVTFTSSSGDVDAEGFVSAGGVMSGTHEGVTIDGTYDLMDCTGDGTWTDQNQGGVTGTYVIELD